MILQIIDITWLIVFGLRPEQEGPLHWTPSLRRSHILQIMIHKDVIVYFGSPKKSFGMFANNLDYDENHKRSILELN